MIPVSFDISSLVDMYSMSLDEVSGLKKEILERVTKSFVRHAKAIAGKELFKTRREYTDSIVVEEDGDNAVIVELIGFIPNAVEQGLSPFDIKRGFQNSDKKKMKIGGGWFLTVPFRHATPSALGEAEMFSEVMSDDVYKVAKGLTQGKSLTKDKLPIEARAVKTRKAINTNSAQYMAYKHKHSKQEGMRKSQKKHHGQYVTFRRVSDKSDPMSWIHSGIDAHNIFDKAINKVDIAYEVDVARDTFFHNIGI
jgi:hypothetical protein